VEQSREQRDVVRLRWADDFAIGQMNLSARASARPPASPGSELEVRCAASQ
jgi:hypothetical protein